MPDYVSKELSRICKNNGSVTAEGVVKEATPTDSPMHRCFEWDDGKAAHKHRLYQARTLIRMNVVYLEEGGLPERLVHVSLAPTSPPAQGESGSAGAYYPISVVVGDSEKHGLAMAEAVKYLAGAKRRLLELCEFDPAYADAYDHVEAAQALLTA